MNSKFQDYVHQYTIPSDDKSENILRNKVLAFRKKSPAVEAIQNLKSKFEKVQQQR